MQLAGFALAGVTHSRKLDFNLHVLPKNLETMTKLVEITKCSDCPNCYYNYNPTGLQSDGKSWCSKSDKQLDLQKRFTEIPEWCELPDTIALGCSHNNIVLQPGESFGYCPDCKKVITITVTMPAAPPR